MHDQCDLDKRFSEPKKIHVDVGVYEEHCRRSLPDSTEEEFFIRFRNSEFYAAWKERTGKTVCMLVHLDSCLFVDAETHVKYNRDKSFRLLASGVSLVKSELENTLVLPQH